jgi:hypothetical protein
LSFDIAEKLRLKSELLICGTWAEPDEPELLDELPLLPQAATTRAAQAAADVTTSLLVTLPLKSSNETTSFVGHCYARTNGLRAWSASGIAAAMPVTLDRRLPAINVVVNITPQALKKS